MDKREDLIPGKLYYFTNKCGLYFNSPNNDSIFLKDLKNTDIFMFIDLMDENNNKCLLKRKNSNFFVDREIGIFLFGNKFGTINLKVGNAINHLEPLGD